MNDEALHKQLPIGENEKVLAVIKHHWFAYVSIYVGAGFLCVLVLAVMVLLSFAQAQFSITDSALNAIIILGIMCMIVIVAFSMIPVWIKKQEMLVLTEEALLQIKKPSVFASKVSQLNLQQIADVTVTQNTLGTMFGFANLAIETPGEQDNYEFTVVTDAREKAKEIIEAHENYAAALESGQMKTTLGVHPPVNASTWDNQPPEQPVSPPAQPQQPPVQTPPVQAPPVNQPPTVLFIPPVAPTQSPPSQIPVPPGQSDEN